jgi:hypothetical protein
MADEIKVFMHTLKPGAQPTEGKGQDRKGIRQSILYCM